MADPVGDTKRLIQIISRMDEDIRLDKWILGFAVPTVVFLMVLIVLLFLKCKPEETKKSAKSEVSYGAPIMTMPMQTVSYSPAPVPMMAAPQMVAAPMMGTFTGRM